MRRESREIGKPTGAENKGKEAEALSRNGEGFLSSESEKLPAEVRIRIGRKYGGYVLHQKHPGLARESGRKGGLVASARHPERRTSAWGKAMAAAKKAKRDALRQLAEAEVLREKGYG